MQMPSLESRKRTTSISGMLLDMRNAEVFFCVGKFHFDHSDFKGKKFCNTSFSTINCHLRLFVKDYNYWDVVALQQI